MTSPKLLALATSLLLLAVAPQANATVGTYAPPTGLSNSGPLVSRVVFSVCDNDTTCSSLLAEGNIQGAEWTFAVGAWTSLCPPPQGKGTASDIICGSTAGYSWYGLAFDYLKFPGDNVNFRRAMQFLQDYSYIQGTVLGRAGGMATNTPVPCFAYSSACNTGPMNSHYGTAQSLITAGEELEETSDGQKAETLYCDNGGTPCAGTYGTLSEWCTFTYCSEGGIPFAPILFYVGPHHEGLWAAAMVSWAAQIGLPIDAHRITNSSAAAACSYPAAREVKRPGAYNPLTGYNSAPALNPAAIAADRCDMFTFGIASSAPALNFLMEGYDSRFAGTPWNPGNVYDGPLNITQADALAGYPAAVPHTLLNNLDYDANQVLYSATAPQADANAHYFMNAYALQVPTVSGYYENILYANSADGWTSFAGEHTTGPNSLAGLRATLLNSHQCGPASCALGGAKGGAIGGTLDEALEALPDQAGLNPLYHVPWAYQAGIWQNVFDGPLTQAPTPVNGTSVLADYLTSSHSVTNLPGPHVLGTGGGWFYFQEPCTTAKSSEHNYVAALSACQGHSGPGQTPGLLQHGVGLPAANRTMYNGQQVTLNFRNGIYFFDGVPVYANDYVFTLNLLDVAGSPNLPDSASPARGMLGGPPGLIAARTLNSRGAPCTVRCPTVNLYLNSESVWNLADLSYPIPGFAAPVLPQHIWRYFNPDAVTSTGAATLDTSRPYLLAVTPSLVRGAPVAPGTGAPTCTSWICFLNNLEVGSGPFWLEGWNVTAGTVEIDANPFYFNSNWEAMAATNGTFEAGTGLTDSSPVRGYHVCPQGGSMEPCVEIQLPLRMPIYNPTGQNMTCTNGVKVLRFTTGVCQLMGTMRGVSWAATGPGRVRVYDEAGTLWRSVPLGRNYTGYYYAFLLTGYSNFNGAACSGPSAVCFRLPAGSYYAAIQTTYYFYGQSRVWYQRIGFSIP